MNKFIVVVVLGIAVITVLCIGVGVTLSKEVVAYTHDFGNVRQNSLLKHTFEVINDTGAPVEYLKATSDCGCTTPDFKAQLLAPDGTMEVPVILSTSGKRGKIKQRVLLHTGDGSATELILLAEAIEEHPSLLDFGVISRGDDTMQEVVIQQFPGQPPLEISKIKFDASILQVSHQESGGNCVIYVSVVPEIKFGEFSEPLRIWTNDLEVPVKTLTAKGYVQFPFEPSESQINLGKFTGRNLAVTHSVQITASYGTRFDDLDLVASGDGAITLSRQEITGNRMDVDIAIVWDEAQEGLQKSVISLDTEFNGEFVKRQIEIYAFIRSEVEAAL